MRLKQCFAWRGMKAAVKDFVQSCAICQQAKYDRSRSPGLLQPLPVPDSAWQVLSMDFIEGLPLSNSFNCILMVIDLLTKYGHFIPLRHPFTAAGVAKAFFQIVYRLLGLPSSIISNRDHIFTSHFWSELFKIVDVSLAVQLTTCSRMGKPRGLTNAWKRISVVMSMRARTSGVSGFLLQNFGTIPAPTLLSVVHHSRPCMVTGPVFWLLILRMCLIMTWQFGLLIAARWINSYIIISTEPN